MAITKYVARRRPTQTEVTTRSHDNDATAARPPTTRSTEQRSHTVATSVAPAAFPSVPTTAPAPEPVYEVGQHGLLQRLDAHEKSNQGRLRRACQRVDHMYSAEKFPATLDEAQKAWYVELKERWLPNEDDGRVSSLQSPCSGQTLTLTAADPLRTTLPLTARHHHRRD